MQQEQRLMQFLMKVNEKYSGTRSNILMMNPLPNLSQAYRLLLQEQKHKEISKAQQNQESLTFGADIRNAENSQTKFNKTYKGGF